MYNNLNLFLIKKTQFFINNYIYFNLFNKNVYIKVSL